MQLSDLAFFTTKELVAELMKRKTFLGVVIHAEQELRGAEWTAGDRVFQIHFNSNLKPEEASRLLDAVATSMNGE